MISLTSHHQNFVNCIMKYMIGFMKRLLMKNASFAPNETHFDFVTLKGLKITPSNRVKTRRLTPFNFFNFFCINLSNLEMSLTREKQLHQSEISKNPFQKSIHVYDSGTQLNLVTKRPQKSCHVNGWPY